MVAKDRHGHDAKVALRCLQMRDFEVRTSRQLEARAYRLELAVRGKTQLEAMVWGKDQLEI